MASHTDSVMKRTCPLASVVVMTLSRDYMRGDANTSCARKLRLSDHRLRYDESDTAANPPPDESLPDCVQQCAGTQLQL